MKIILHVPNRSFVQVIFWALLFWLALSNARAQTTNTEPSRAAEKNSPELSSRQTAVTFQSKVNLVLVTVVVRDAQQRPVGTLQKEDFQLFDKGKPQVIAKFSVEKSGSQAAADAKRLDGYTRSPVDGAGTPLAAPERYVAYLFDDVHANFGDLVRVRDAVDHHLASLDPASRAAIFSTSGQTTLDFTDDRDKLHQTLLRLQPRPVSRFAGEECPKITYYMADLIQNKNDAGALRAGMLDAQLCLPPDTPQTMIEQLVRSAASRAMSLGEAESRVALRVFLDTVRRTSAMPGQRVIVLLSPGFLTPFDLQQNKTEIMDRAIRANIVISALDARGLYTAIPGGDASVASTGSPLSAGVRAQYDVASASVESDVLAELAEGTGGTFFHNRNDLAAGVERLAAAPDHYYVLGFSPQNLKLDGSFHKLKVTLKEPGKLALQARRGYYAPRHQADAAETAKQEIQEAIFSREEMRDIPVELHTQFFKASEENARLAVLARVDLKQIHFRKVDGRNRNDLTIAYALFDRNGNYVTGMQKLLEMRLRDETLNNKQRSVITVKTDFDVKPGSYLVRLVVRDTEGQLMAAQNGAVEIQ